MKILRYIMILLMALAFSVSAESPGYQEWRKRRESLINDKNVARYYTFEDVAGSKSIVRDLSGKGGDLKFVPYTDRQTKEVFDDLKIIEGRWPEKKAARLDRGFYQGPTYNIENKQFTVEAWFRRQGPGSILAASRNRDGHIMSVSGYREGWRIYTSYDPVSGIVLGIGKQGGCNIRTEAAMPDNAWHHISFTWDGRIINLYLNGKLISSNVFEEEYIPVKHANFFKIGFSELGVGSIVMDIDEVVIYNRVLSGKEIEKLSRGPLNESEKDIFAAADAFIKDGNYGAARAQYEKLKSLPVYGLPLALFNTAESYRLEKDYEGAHRIYGQIMKMENLSAYYRIYGLFRQAELCLEQKNYEGARRLYNQVIKTEGALKHHIFNARLFTADTYKAGLIYSRARPLYEELLREEESASFPNDGYRLDVRDRLEAIEGLADGTVIKNSSQKRLERVNGPGYAVYVSTLGSDSDPGTKEKPFATFKRAQEEVRRVKSKGMPEGGIVVYLRGGNYFLTDGIVFGKDDSGTEKGPVVYRNYPGEEARLIGGRQVSNFKLLDDPGILKRLAGEAKGKVWVADLKEAGITEYGRLLPRGRHVRKSRPGALELICDGKIMRLARWPNEGWERVAGLTVVEGVSRKTEYQRGKFVYSGDRPERWKEEKDMWVKGYLGVNQPYSLIHIKIGEIDTEKKVINLLPDILPDADRWLAVAPVAKDHPYYVYNILSELDVPGEFYLDRETGKLYFYPPGEIKKSEVIATTLDKPVVSFNNASDIILFGLVVEGTWRSGVEIRGGRENLVAGSTIRNTGQFAVRIESGWNHSVVGCDMYDMGEGGVSLNGGDRTKLIPARHIVENNHIYRFNRFCGGYRTALWIEGTGQIVSHNVIHDSPMQGIYFDENDHVIEFNDMHDVVYEGRELGAMYIYGERTALMNRGTVIRNNFFHHVSTHSSPNLTHGLNAIHIDAMNSGLVIEKNIFYRVPTGISSTFPGNYLNNNIFIDGEGTGIGQSDRSYIFCKDLNIDAGPNLQTMSHLAVYHKMFRTKQPPWSYRYPPIFELIKHEPAGWGKIQGSIIERNMNTGGRFVSFSSDTKETTLFRNNWDGQDPMFRNKEKMDFTLRPGAPVFGITGCDPVKADKTGVYEDGLRASWPIKRTAQDIGKYYKSDWNAASEIKAAMKALKRISQPLTYEILPAQKPIIIDGETGKDEWPGLFDKKKAMLINKHFQGGDKKGPDTYSCLYYDRNFLYIATLHEPDPWNTGMPERIKKHLPVFEIAIESQTGAHSRGWWLEDMPTGPIYVVWGYGDGRVEVKDNFKMPFETVQNIQKSIEYKRLLMDEENQSWMSEMKIPLSSIGINPSEVDQLAFNIGVSKRSGWFAWVPTGDAIWRIENAGFIKFVK